MRMVFKCYWMLLMRYKHSEPKTHWCWLSWACLLLIYFHYLSDKTGHFFKFNIKVKYHNNFMYSAVKSEIFLQTVISFRIHYSESSWPQCAYSCLACICKIIKAWYNWRPTWVILAQHSDIIWNIHGGHKQEAMRPLSKAYFLSLWNIYLHVKFVIPVWTLLQCAIIVTSMLS